MQTSKQCLFCGTEFEMGHINAAHKAKKAQFTKYHTIVVDVAAPMLGRIDSARAALLAEDAADEKAETARFEALHELQRSYEDLNRAMDDIEARVAWERLEPLRSAAEFAQLAVDAADVLARASLVGGMAAAPAAENAANGRLAGAQVESAEVEGIGGASGLVLEMGGEMGGAHDEEDEEDELDHLSQMVAHASKRRGWRPAGGGGGGGSHRRSRGGGRRRNKGKGGDVD